MSSISPNSFSQPINRKTKEKKEKKGRKIDVRENQGMRKENHQGKMKKRKWKNLYTHNQKKNKKKERNKKTGKCSNGFPVNDLRPFP